MNCIFPYDLQRTRGIKKDIVCLTVHDAVAVPQEDLKCVEETMLESRDRQMETSGLARVKVDLP